MRFDARGLRKGQAGHGSGPDCREYGPRKANEGGFGGCRLHYSRDWFVSVQAQEILHAALQNNQRMRARREIEDGPGREITYGMMENKCYEQRRIKG